MSRGNVYFGERWVGKWSDHPGVSVTRSDLCVFRCDRSARLARLWIPAGTCVRDVRYDPVICADRFATLIEGAWVECHGHCGGLPVQTIPMERR